MTDYAALAEQARQQAASPPVDYAAMADQARAQQQDQPGVMAHLGAVVSGMNPFPGLAQTVMHPVDAVTSQLNRMGELRGQAAQDFKKGNYNDALYHGLGGITPGIGPMAADFIDGIDPKGNSMDQAKQLGGLLMPAAMKAVPPIVRKAGAGLQKAAEPITGSALAIRAADRAFGKTPERFALDETSGFNPDKVAESARQRIGLLNTELENRAAASTTPVSLQPAIDVIDKRSATASAGNSSYTPAELDRMRSHLTEPQPGFGGLLDPNGGIATDQPASVGLRMKREFGKDFTKFNPLNPSGEMGTARNVYHSLDAGLDNAIPGGDELNQRISSGIPVAERAEMQDLNAGVGQRVMHRIAAHSGALLGAGAGYAAGGVPGAVAGLIIPEVISSPTARMAAARAINGAGRAFGSTAAQKAAQAALLSGGLLMNGQRQRKGLLDQ